MELTKKQAEGLKLILEKYRNHEKFVTIAGYAGTGKAQPLDTKIPTPEGFKYLGDLKVGDFVFDRQGKPTKVLGVFPQGKKRVYRVKFEDGRESLCAGDHLWTVYNEDNELSTRTTVELIGGKYSTPVNSAVEIKGHRFGNIEQRLQFVKDHFDIDKFSTFIMKASDSLKRLLDDIREVLWSLGYTFTILKNGDYYFLHIKFHNNKLFIMNVEELDYDAKMVCIYVDNDEHLYLTEDYIVTHNTTLVKFAIEALEVDPEDVAYAAYTGKAAEVLRAKGNKNALTTHKLLYKFQPLEDGTFIKVKKDELEYSVIIIDEVSMFPKSMLEDLLSFDDIFVIFLGDPFQLPVINKKDSHDLLDHPDIFLDEIMRQAAESEIIQLTMKIRAGEKIDFSHGKEVIIIPETDFVTGHLLWADQVLCATNATRNALNSQMRELLGYSGDPKEGEKMICLRNYWDKCSFDKECALVNGMTGTLISPLTKRGYLPYWVRVQNKRPEYLMSGFQTEDGAEFKNLNMDKKLIMTGESTYDSEEKYNLRGLVKKVGFNPVPFEFAFGYCITTHKSQGSEWDKVTVVEEGFPYNKLEHARWLYTACTRAAEKLVLIRNE